MAKYRKKPVEIEAVPCREVLDAMETDWSALPLWIAQAYENGVIVAPTRQDGGSLTIKTLEGDHLARTEDWIIRGVKDELYPCKPDIFEATYELVGKPRKEQNDHGE